MQKTLLKSLLALALTGFSLNAPAQWVAFDDHFSGPGTGANVTDYNVFGTAGGAPSNSGLLKNVATGAVLPVTLSITGSGMAGGASAGVPNSGTPAYNLFNGFVDWGSGTLNHAVQVGSAASVTYTFTGLDPSKMYNFAGTGVRGGTDAAVYGIRWCVFSLEGADAYENKATAGCYTSGLPANQTAVNTGMNAAGDMAVWDKINPGADGTISIVCRQYLGAITGGGSAAQGSYGYALGGIRLEELAPVNVPVAITSQPVDQTVTEVQPVTFSVGYIGGPSPAFQWYKTLAGNTTALLDGTNANYTIPFASMADNGAAFFVVASNFVTNTSFTVVSSNAVLTVIPDLSAPVLVSAASGLPNLIYVSYSEPVSAVTATNKSNYHVTFPGGTLVILDAVLSIDQSNVVLTTVAQGLGVTYTMTVNGIRDQSVAGNLIADNSQASFTTVSYQPVDIGSPTTHGVSVATNGGFNVTSGGSDIGTTTDQFTLNYQQRIGDFDVKVRVAGMTFSDTWAKAGLMARETLNANSRYAATMTSPSLAGSFFQSRATAGAAATSAGNLPANIPNTWLRLQRTGVVLTGFASYDGKIWTQLGSVTLTGLPTSIYLGMATTSRNTNQATTVQFRDLSNVTDPIVGRQATTTREPLGPSSRRTGMTITEIMYKPSARADVKNLEFVEIFNSNPFFEDLSGWRLAGDVDFEFPKGTILRGGEFLVIAAAPQDIKDVYGIENVVGPYTNTLKVAGLVRLRTDIDAIVLEVNYSNKRPWPAGADGTGHSIVLAKPSYGENYPQAWAISGVVGGSPGAMDGASYTPEQNVVINEFLAHSELPLLDYIELYNHSGVAVDLSGCFLSDDPATNKFIIPQGTTIPARGFHVFYADQLGFGLNTEGETIYFRNAANDRVVDAVDYTAQAMGVSSGRYPDGASSFYLMSSRTPGASNAIPWRSDVVINELMFKPLSDLNDDEFVELYNRSAQPVDISGWKFTSGIGFTIPTNTIMAPDSYLVIAKNISRLLTNYPNLNANNTLGDYSGSLGNSGDRVAFAMPEPIVVTNTHGIVKTNTAYVDMDEVTYSASGRWGHWSDGGGSSMELVDPSANGRLASNWADSEDSQKSSNMWTSFEFTGLLDSGAPYGGSIDRLDLTLLGEGECLLDNVEVIGPAGANMLSATNSTFEAGIGSWVPQGDHIRTTVETTAGYLSSQSLHVRASDRGDIGNNRVRVAFTALSGNQTATIRAKVRWLKGWPEIVLRMKGNYIEAYGRMQVPANLGTPGARNSRYAANVGPAIYEVKHAPVVPAASESVVVTARANDAQGVSSLALKYRLDPSTTYTTVNMVDNGTGGDAVAGDGIFSATIPGQPATTIVGFYVQATDGAASPLTTMFPSDAPAHECLVRFGEPAGSPGFGVYRYWLAQSTVATWINRPNLSNERLDGTFTYGDFRAVYNVGGKYGGSPYHQQYASPVDSPSQYALSLPSDDLVLGTDNFNKLHMSGNGPGDDATFQGEQTGFWVAKKMHIPYNYRRYIAMFVNGVRKGAFIEDTQVPGPDSISEYYPNEPVGYFYKLMPWFEFDDMNVTGATAAGFANNGWCTFVNYFTPTGARRTPRYRQNFQYRVNLGSSYDYTPVYQLVDTTSATTNVLYEANMNALVDIDEWVRTFAVRHSAGDWDSVGYRNQQNTYAYKPLAGTWKLMIWDMNHVYGVSGGADVPDVKFLTETPSYDPAMQYIFNYPPFRRAYFRALKEVATVAYDPTTLATMLDSKYNAFIQSGQSASAPSGIKSYCANMRNVILNMTAVPGEFTVKGTNSFSTGNNLVQLTGTALYEVTAIKVNGVNRKVTWTAADTWSLSVAVQEATNRLVIQGYDNQGNVVPAATNVITVRYTNAVLVPQGNVVISEIMYNPVTNGAAYVEIFNNSATFAFDMSNWKIKGLGYTFPPETTIAPRTSLVVAQDRMIFSAIYPGISIFDTYTGVLKTNGEALTLTRPVLNASDMLVDEMVSEVRFDATAPWPPLANGKGSALQLVDPTRDNSRVMNWSDGSGWRYYSFTATNSGTSKLLKIYPDVAGDIFIDDLKLVAGRVPEVGANLIVGGDFEGLFTTNQGGPWWFAGAYGTNSALVTNVSHSGNGSMHLVYTTAASGFASYPLQQNTLLPGAGAYTLSFWYLPGTNISALNFYMHSTFRPVPNVKPTFFTPGAPSSMASSLPPMPPLYLSEVQAENITGPVDSNGARNPWVEVYNSGTTNIDLTGWYLTDTYTNLGNWAFPSNTVIQPGQYMVVWADGHPEQTVDTTNLHTSFRLTATNGSIALVTKLGQSWVVYDYLNYDTLPADLSYGESPDGQVVHRQQFTYVTAGQSNNPATMPVQVYINEWMADNATTISNPSALPNLKFDDWFELYNATTNAVDLGGYYLSQSTADRTLFKIPAGYVIPPHGYLMVWADGVSTRNNLALSPLLHTPFKLGKTGDSIGLFAADGTQIDFVTFGPQATDVTQGRYPDGGAIVTLSRPTPGAVNAYDNVVVNNTPPILGVITNYNVVLGQSFSFTATAFDMDIPAQTLTFSLLSAPANASIGPLTGQFNWTPLPNQAPSTNTIALRVADSGTPSMSATNTFVVKVYLPPQFDQRQVSINGNQISIGFSTAPNKTYQVIYKDSLNDPWSLLGAPRTATSDTMTITDTLIGHTQRFYGIRLLNQ